jgi:hypothetical protein
LLSLENGADCWGNTQNLTCSFILPEQADSFDLVINEVLFNPLTGGEDFVELYNRSEKYINLKDYSLASIDADTVSNLKSSPTPNPPANPNPPLTPKQDLYS